MAKIAAPLALKLSSHWVLRRGKQPFNSYGNPKGWTQPEFWITFDEAVKVLESNPKKFDGIGYIVARDPLREGDQILGGDLDCCRDPVTGQGSRWALSILEKLNTCAAVSISKCGYRFFCYGKLPEGLNDVMGHGHDDLTEDMKAHILEAKPKAGEKLAKGQPVWNGFELYEDGPKHLTITGEWLPEYQAELQHRQTEIAEIIGPFLKVAKAKEAPKQRIKRKGSLPPLSVLDVIDTSGFSRVADELVGPNPVIGSIHGTNLKVNDGQNIWCNFHNNIKKGGDAWLWLACECGAIQWEEAGPGALSDPTVLKKVKQYAIEKGYFTAEELDVVAGMEIADALSLVDDLKDQEKVKADPGLPFEPQYVRALAVVKRHNKAEYERTRAALKKARVHVGELDKAINQIQGVGGSARKIVNSDIGIITFDDVCKANNDGYEFSTTQAANAVTSKLKLVMEEGNDRQIWYFDGKFYVNNGKSLISHLLYTAGDDYAQKRLVAEVLDRVTSELQLSPIKFNPKPFQFGCLDGLLDLSTGKFRGYRPEDYITISHQVSYELEGDIRPFLWFLSTIFPDPRDVLTAIDIFTATGMRIPFDSFIQLIGGGSDGKGIFEKIMIILFSPPRTTAMTIRELKDNPRFGPGQLLDKDLWIVSEVSSAKDATDILKKIATGEFIDSDEKYATERKRGRPHATTILDCNNAFDFADDSWGRKRRQIKLDCPFRFGDLKGDRPIDRHLEEKLTQPQILSAIIKLMGARGPYLAKERKIYTRKRPEEMAEEYRRQQYSLNYFCEECLEASPGAVLLVKDCYNEYLEYCRYFAVPTPAERSPFGKYIKACFGIESKSEDGKRVYRGLAINAKAFTVWAQEKSNYEISNKSDDEIGIDWKKTAKNRRNTALYTTYLGEINNNGGVYTADTGEYLKSVINEIMRMFEWIDEHNPEEITYENYVRDFPDFAVSAVSPVSPVYIDSSEPTEIKSVVYSAEDEQESLVSELKSDVKQGKEQDKEKTSNFCAKCGITMGMSAYLPGLGEVCLKCHSDLVDDKQVARKSEKTEDACLACGADISPGHGNYYGKFCSSCGPKIPIIRAAAKVQLDGFILSDLWEELAARGRAPRKEHLTKMLRYLGCVEEGETWRWL